MSPEEKVDCRRLINHLREMSWGANKQAVSLKGDQHLSVKEKGPVLLRLPDKTRVCSQHTNRGDDHGQTQGH